MLSDYLLLRTHYISCQKELPSPHRVVLYLYPLLVCNPVLSDSIYISFYYFRVDYPLPKLITIRAPHVQ